MAAYQNYIFDLYGTLVDIRTDEKSRLLWQKAALYYAETGAPYTAAELHRRYLNLCETEQARHADPLYEIELRKVFRALYEEKGVRPGRRAVEAAALFFRVSSTKKLRLYPWVRPVFAQIRAEGARIWLLSNAQACFTLPELRGLGLDRLLDGWVLSSDAQVKKPSPAIMRRLLDTCGLSAETSLMIGNDAFADVGVARAVGMDALYLETETSPPREGAPLPRFQLLDEDYARLPALLGLDAASSVPG